MIYRNKATKYNSYFSIAQNGMSIIIFTNLREYVKGIK